MECFSKQWYIGELVDRKQELHRGLKVMASSKQKKKTLGLFFHIIIIYYKKLRTLKTKQSVGGGIGATLGVSSSTDLFMKAITLILCLLNMIS